MELDRTQFVLLRQWAVDWSCSYTLHFSRCVAMGREGKRL